MDPDPGPTAVPAALRVIGHVASGLTRPGDAPRQPDEGAPGATLHFDPALAPGLEGLTPGDEIVVVTWLHLADRHVLAVHPRDDPGRPVQGVFATRSADRPNPIGLHHTTITSVDGPVVAVDRLEAVEGTPVLDVKPVLRQVKER